MAMPRQIKILGVALAAFYVAAGAGIECMPRAEGTDIVQGCLRGQGMDVTAQILIRPNACLLTPGSLIVKGWKALSPS